MTFKRKSAQELIGPIKDDLDPTDQAFWAQQRAARQAELRGAVVVGRLLERPHPGTLAVEVYERLSDPQRPPTEALLKLLRHLGEA